LRKGHFH